MKRSFLAAVGLVAVLLAGGVVVGGAAGGGPAGGEGLGEMEQMVKFLDIVEKMVSFQKNWHEHVKTSDRAIVAAAFSVEELVGGDKAKQAGILRGYLKTVKDQGARNVILFAIKDALKDADKKDEALKVLEEIIAENAAATEGKK